MDALLQPHREGGPWFKVVWKDGYNRESVAERETCGHMTSRLASLVCEHLRETSKWDGNWWIVVPQTRPLWGGMAELV